MSLANTHITALILRLGFGLNMAIGHGWGKFQKLISGDEINFPEVLGMPALLSLLLAVLGEFIACILIVLGYKTKYAAILAIATMFVAAFFMHFDDPWFSKGGGSKEMAVLYLTGFVAIFFIGSGKYSLDAKIGSDY